MEQENKQNPETELQVNDKYVKNNIDLDLGDIIEIISPQNPEYHETTNYIDYIDDKVILLTNKNNKIISENLRFTLELPTTNEHLTPFIMTVPLQLLAYNVASLKNLDIDKPRNLAKSVTVE